MAMQAYRSRKAFGGEFDYCIADPRSARFDGRGYVLEACVTNLEADPTSVCWGVVSPDFLRMHYKRIAMARVPAEWAVLTVRADWYNKEQRAGHAEPSLPYPPPGTEWMAAA